MDKLRKEYPDIAPTGPTHVRAVRYGDLMFMSGVTALGTSAYGKSIVDQASAALSKIKNIKSIHYSFTQDFQLILIRILQWLSLLD